MGITIGTNRKDLSMGYGSFRNFRIEVSKAFSEDFGESYEFYLNRVADELFRIGTIEDENREFNDYLKTVNIDDDIVDFLFQSDSAGKISYKTARKIRDLCRKSDCPYKFGYGDPMSMLEIAEIFDDAVKHRCNVMWA